MGPSVLDVRPARKLIHAGHFKIAHRQLSSLARTFLSPFLSLCRVYRIRANDLAARVTHKKVLSISSSSAESFVFFPPFPCFSSFSIDEDYRVRFRGIN